MHCFENAAYTTRDNTVKARANYNRGNAAFMLATHTPEISREDAIRSLQHAVNSYQTALNINPDYEDAAFNLKTALQMLHMIQNNSQQQQQNDDNADSNDEDNENSDENSSNSQNSNSSAAADQQEKQEVKPPNLTPEDIIKEENKNRLKRSRKTHADFGKVKTNW